MNGYIAFYKNRPQLEVYAETLLEARSQAVKHFKARKDWEVNIMIAEKNVVSDGNGGWLPGEQVVHVAVN